MAVSMSIVSIIAPLVDAAARGKPPQVVRRRCRRAAKGTLAAFERGPDERKQRGARCCFQLAAHEQVFLDIAWSTFNDISRRPPVRLAVLILVDRRAPCGIRH